MTTRHPVERSSIVWLIILLILLPVYYLGANVAFSYATMDLREGHWVSLIIDHLRPDDRGEPLDLLGARSRLIWSALAMLYLLVMVSTGAFSLIVLVSRAGRYWKPMVGALAVLAIGVGAGAWWGVAQSSGCVVDPCGEGCPTTSDGIFFSVVPYMGEVFCRIRYERSFVTWFQGFYAVTVPCHQAIMMSFFLATLSLIVGPPSTEQWTVEDLRQRVSDLLVLVMLGSAILTIMGLFELTLWGWLAEIADDWEHAAKLRNLQVGSALFWGMSNSTLMVLVFAPIGVLLQRRARALARVHNEGASTPALVAWEREHGVTLLGRAIWPQIGGVLAPLLTGALAFLFQSVVGGG
jgi:hypothetical protein